MFGDEFLRHMHWIALVLAVTVVAESDIGTNSDTQLQNFCRRFEHRTAVLDNKIYIDGGFVNASPLSQDDTNYTNTQMFYSDLLTTESTSGMPEMKASFPKGPTIPAVAGGALWSDPINGKLFTFGGYQPLVEPTPFRTWTYDESDSTWRNTSTNGDTVSYVAHGMSAVAVDAGVAYYLGGYHDSQTDAGWSAPRRYTPNLIEFDMVTRKYSNSSGPNETGRGEGIMVFVPASTSGLLIYFGGIVHDTNGYGVHGASMQDIWIYDISLQIWYKQEATGTIPEQRTRFCGAAAWPDDQSSFNIYLYGGLRPNAEMINGSMGFDDLYILSLPSFTWVKMWPAPSEVGFIAVPHHSLTCDIINGTQMIVMGGTFPNSTTCDSPNSFAQHNVDLGELNDIKAPWYSFRNDSPPYRVPRALTKIIGGTAKGGANVTGPFSNRTYDEYLFEKTYKVPQRYPTPAESASPSSTPTGDKSNSKSVLIAATIGSVGAGIVIGATVFFALNHYRKNLKMKKLIENASSSKDSSDGASDGKIVDHKAPMVELHAPDRVEVPSQYPEELWADPAELPNWRSSRGELPGSAYNIGYNERIQQAGVAI